MLANRVECCLQRNPCRPATDREWAHCIIRHSSIAIEALAARTEIPAKRLMKISAPQGEKLPTPRELARITKATGRVDWLRFYAREADCEVFPMPVVDIHESGSEVIDESCAALRSLSDVLDELRLVARERHLTPEDRAKFDDLVGVHYAHVARAEAWVDQHQSGPRTVRRRA